MRAAMVRMLRGYETVLAATGEAAKKILAADPDFDLILCDVMMPRVSGVDLHEWLVQANPALAEKVVFVTGGAFTPRVRDYLQNTENIWVEKPIDVGSFKKIVNDRIRLHRATQEAPLA
jgi:CheY-like chemotaxis protein